jgi:large subunit ribosomal protein L25
MASPKRPSLVVEERPERGSRAIRRLRREGFVPGVVYGGGDGDCTSFKVGARDLRTALHAGSAVLDLEVAGGKALPVIVKDQQIHPVRDEIVHIDLLEVRLDEKIQAPVTVELEGAEEAPGIKEGGVLEHVTRELNIEALPADIPDNITVEVSGLEIAATMHLSEVTAPSGVTFLDDPEETIIATVVVPTEVEEPEVEEETELVGEDGEPIEPGEEVEAEAGAEGDTGEEAEQKAEAAEGEDS